MTIAGLCGLIIFVLLAVMLIAGVPIAVALAVSSILRDLAGFKYGCKRTDRRPENFLRYLRIQPSCHSFLYPGRKPDE